MKFSRIMLVLACFIGLTQPAWSQKSPAKAGNGILGYLDPQTGAFKPLVQAPASPEEADALAAIVPTTGTLVFNITITVKSSIGTDTVACDANADVFEALTSQSIGETGLVTATGSGGTRTCKVTIPYSWLLSTPGSDSVSLNIDVFAATSTNLLQQPARGHTQSLPPIKVPTLGGTTTTFTVAVTL